ncbi:MAG: helix-turn-helix domain-containing protein [Acidimicrobiia bacterium]|nr:helix-turn-helix domain-containing protein [Acidimicrobiia bacterium]
MDRLDDDTCYAAITRRDARFDGRFYTAVVTTGVFCRPSCPARTPKSTNVRFYPHAATATEAGFRPCRRCRPELAPGHPEWNRRADLAGRAMALIDDGAVDRVGVTGLAAALAVSERHLRRELVATVGTGPLQLARTRRLWLARLLLDQTDLPITDVAFASGFGSVRQFNDSMRRTFGEAPSTLRRRPAPRRADRTITLSLPSRGALRWPGLHTFLSTRAIPGLEAATEAGVRRNVPGGWLELSGPDTGGRALRLRCSLDRLADLTELVPIVRRVADLDTDLEPIEHRFEADPLLAARLARTELGRLPGAFDRFEIAVRAIVGQQISVAGARTLLGRLLVMTRNPVSVPATDDDDDGGARPPSIDRFPSPETLAAHPLDGLGMPARRRATIRALARAVADGTILLDAGADPERTRAQLLDVGGIGPWTAGYITMRSLSDPDGWPVGDLGLRRSLAVSAAQLEASAEQWRPWRAYAALFLWQSDPTQNPPPIATASPRSTTSGAPT